MKCLHYYIAGQVQGVFYRASARDVAVGLGLTGWVRNLADGRVESVACGRDEQLVQYENWLKQGPPMAVVDNVDISQESAILGTSGFNVKY